MAYRKDSFIMRTLVEFFKELSFDTGLFRKIGLSFEGNNYKSRTI